MSKSLENAIKVERECTDLCKSKQHAAKCIAATTKRGVTDRQLASYLFHLCANFVKKQDEMGHSVLHIAATCGKHELAQWLITQAGANPNVRDYESGYTPLHRAVYYGHINIAVRLIQFGSNLEASDNEDMTVLDMLCKERSPLDPLSILVQCQAYVWGVNKNFSLGTGSDNSRKSPELLEITKQPVSIIQAELEELHSVYVSRCGKVWACGMGHGGRLGSGSNSSSLTPQPIKTSSKCISAAVGINHTLLLLENHTVVSCGMNFEHQLGVNPWVESCLSPRQVCPFNFTSTNPITGICAAKYHSVFYNDSAVWTCGLNGGQHGRGSTNQTSSSSSFITKPMKVPLGLNGRKITYVATGVGAIVVAVDNCDIYILHKFQCKKMVSKQLGIVKIGVFGGSLEVDCVTEPPIELRVIMLTVSGGILLWKEGAQRPIRCIFGLKQSINVADFCLTQQHLLIVTKDGCAFQGTFTNTQPSVELLTEKTIEKANLFHKFIEMSKCYRVVLKRLPNIFRAVAITADPRGNNLAVIQIHPKTALTDIPVISDSKILQQVLTLYVEASEEDSVHDAIFKVAGKTFPVHCYILSILGKQLAEEAYREKTITFKDMNPYIFEQILIFLYTGFCDLVQPGPFSTRKIGKKDDPLRMAIEFCNKYKIQTLSKKLHKLRYHNGYVLLKDESDIPGVESIKYSNKFWCESYDVAIKSDDGSLFEAHKCILVARMDYFRSMFLGGWSETGSKRVLQLPLPSRVLKDLIDFIYTDEIPDQLSAEEDLDHIIRLLIAGDQLLVARLKECCELLLINTLTLRNAPTVLHLASVYNCPQLKASSIQFISLNLPSFLQSRLLEVLDDSVLQELADYYKEFSKKKYRILTPFPDAPCDEEIISLPSIPWPDEFSLLSKVEMPVEMKAPPSATKKKKTVKKLIASAADGVDITETEVVSQPSLQQPVEPEPIVTLPEASAIKENIAPLPENNNTEESIWSDNKQFPQLDSFPDKSKNKRSQIPIKESVISNRMSPLVKISQKERKHRLLSEGENRESIIPIASSPPTKPPKTWATLPPLPTEIIPSQSSTIDASTREPVTEDTKFINIIASDKEKKANLAKMKSKPFHLTQLEDKAMDELMVFYNASNEFDERITVERVFSHNIDMPRWITSKKP